MKYRLALSMLATILLFAGCTRAPEPGDLAAFCGLLGQGSGLSATASEAEYAELAEVAPPAIIDTIEALQTQARDFGELLNSEPPDLGAIFTAKFDPAAATERAALDRYAADSCSLIVDRPPTVRWANYIRANYSEAPWRQTSSTSFEVGTNKLITAASVTIELTESEMEQAEQVCEALTDFLLADGSSAATIRVNVGTVVVIDKADSDGSCQLP